MIKQLTRLASKAVVKGWLLKFPGGDPKSSIACVYCPEMCRFSCPTAVASGNDAVTPSNKMSSLHWGNESWPIYDCTGCGRCTEYCVYDMPVAERLFEARKKAGWERAHTVARGLEDPWGDLHWELGVSGAEPGAASGWIEPQAFYFHTRVLNRSFAAPWDGWRFGTKVLKGRWLLHESVWHSRRLGRFEQVDAWAKELASAGVDLVRPFEHGMDCVDCGGEGAYSRLFPKQAQVMAQDFWDREKGRADGILCVSDRCAEHLRKVLGPSVQVESMRKWAS